MYFFLIMIIVLTAGILILNGSPRQCRKKSNNQTHEKEIRCRAEDSAIEVSGEYTSMDDVTEPDIRPEGVSEPVGSNSHSITNDRISGIRKTTPSFRAMINSPEAARRAFILTQIFTRKY